MTLWGIFGHIMAQNPISFLLLKQECWFKVTQMHREKTKPNQTKKKRQQQKIELTTLIYSIDFCGWLHETQSQNLFTSLRWNRSNQKQFRWFGYFVVVVVFLLVSLKNCKQFAFYFNSFYSFVLRLTVSKQYL